MRSYLYGCRNWRQRAVCHGERRYVARSDCCKSYRRGVVGPGVSNSAAGVACGKGYVCCRSGVADNLIARLNNIGRRIDRDGKGL